MTHLQTRWRTGDGYLPPVYSPPCSPSPHGFKLALDHSFNMSSGHPIKGLILPGRKNKSNDNEDTVGLLCGREGWQVLQFDLSLVFDCTMKSHDCSLFDRQGGSIKTFRFMSNITEPSLGKKPNDLKQSFVRAQNRCEIGKEKDII